MSNVEDILWTAPRDRQDWRDEATLAAVEWLTSLVPTTEWSARSSAAQAVFDAAKRDWATGRRTALFDPADMICWYLMQARCFGDPRFRGDFFEIEGYRIAPMLRRLGQLLPTLRRVEGAEERAARLMRDGKDRPDDGLYELLVAGCYRNRGWDRVAFVPETPGRGKTPDLLVTRSRSSWAVECKRAGRSGYARDERLHGERLSAGAHALSRRRRRPLGVMARFDAELEALPDDYLSNKVDRFLRGSEPFEWRDDKGAGGVFDLNQRSLQLVLSRDDVHFGSSRMIELLLGRYEASVDYSVEGDWTPARNRPFHAHSVGHVSLTAWSSVSEASARRKAQHFRGVVGRASEQLPGDRPGVIHVGYEAIGGNSVDGLRHHLNARKMKSFDGSKKRLKWVYGNYLTPEHVTAPNESSAISETTAFYRVGATRTAEPLQGHLLFEDADGRPGAHFAR